MSTFAAFISFFQSQATLTGAIVGVLTILVLVVALYSWSRKRPKKHIKGRYYERSEELKPLQLAVIKKIEQKNKSRVIAIIHRDDPDESGINENTAEDMLDVLRQIDRNERLDIILHTPGGYTIDTLRIAFAIKAHKGPKTVYVPYLAMSGGTLIALAAHEIVMADHAVLGPIDPSVGGIPAASLLELRRTRDQNKERMDDITFLFTDMAAKAMQQVRTHACELINDKVISADQCTITNRLVSGEWTHDYPITKSKAVELGLAISKKDMPAEMFELIALYPGRNKRDPAVKFVLAANQSDQHKLQFTLGTGINHV